MVLAYKDDKRVGEILKVLFQGGIGTRKIGIKGLVGSGKAFVCAAIVEGGAAGKHLFILRDKEQAAYFYNDLCKIFSQMQKIRQVLFFPASYKHPYEIDKTDNANVLQRTEVLNSLRESENTLTVTYPEAIAEKVFAPEALSENTVKIHTGEALSQDFLIDFFDEYGFRLVDFVAEAGEYAIRGGIIDIYSYSNDLPYRIELDGENVASIRTFEIGTQRSAEYIKEMSVLPLLKKHAAKDYVSLLNYFSPYSIIWTEDLQNTLSVIKDAYIRIKNAYNNEELYVQEETIKEQIEQHSVVELGSSAFYKHHFSQNFSMNVQPLFNKRFDMLSENILSNADNGIYTYIFSENPKQIKRLERIFAELPNNYGVPPAARLRSQQGSGFPSNSSPCSAIAPQGCGVSAQSLTHSPAQATPHSPAPGIFTPIPLSIHEGFIDHEIKIACYTDHQIFERFHGYAVSPHRADREALTVKELYALKIGDYVSHIDHGVGQFAGLEKLSVNGKEQEVIRVLYKDNDLLRISIHSLHKITRYSSKDGTPPALHRLGGNAWQTLKNKAKKKIKDIARDLIRLYAKRKETTGFSFAPDNYLQHELESSFFYEDTPDQLKATIDVKQDMEASSPMDRLVCGDVGFGKTEVAIRAAFKAVCDSKQVAVLVPTTVLAYQHHNTFKERLEGLPCNVDYLNRFRSVQDRREILKKVKEGKIDILIGTHRIVSKDVVFKDLGLLIIDEEQKFGVSTKEKLKSLKVNVDTLTLTATPIPRTLQFSLMGARDLSLIQTPPPNRYPISTEIHSFDENYIREAIVKELERGGQVFFVHHRVENIDKIGDLVKTLVPDAKVAIAHGQMDGDKLEEVLLGFMEGVYDILVSTKIVENGLDIPNANTIIINNANQYGLSELYQLRGRVGRSNKKAYCYMLVQSTHTLTNEAQKRLAAIEEFAEIGSGFQVAMRDLDIRGAGNILGGEQSGFISEIGYDMYQRILDEAITELRDEELKSKPSSEPLSEYDLPPLKEWQFDSDLELLIPDSYVSNITERLTLYKDLNALETDEQISDFRAMLQDRFGAIPQSTQSLINTIVLRRLSKKIGWEKVVLKNGNMTATFGYMAEAEYFKSLMFTGILDYIQKNPKESLLKEKGDKLNFFVNNIPTVEASIAVAADIFIDNEHLRSDL